MTVTYEVPTSGFYVVSGVLSPGVIQRIVDAVHEHARTFPFVHPRMRNGTLLSVEVTSFGDFGWWSDERGYCYTPTHPTTGRPWPEIPHVIRGITSTALYAAMPRVDHDRWAVSVDTVLVNRYAADASLGWHVDRTEADLVSPIVTLSIGADAVFEIRLNGKVHKMMVRNGDFVVMAGESRNAEHRVSRILPNPLLGEVGRMSITWRRTGLTPGGSPCA